MGTTSTNPSVASEPVGSEPVATEPVATEPVASIARITGAMLVLLGGSIHLQQWYRVYRDLEIGPTFIANVVVSLLVGIALLGTRPMHRGGGERTSRLHDWPALAGILVSVGSLVALLLSRTTGLLGFEAIGYEAPEVAAIVAEAGALVALLVSMVAARRFPV